MRPPCCGAGGRSAGSSATCLRRFGSWGRRLVSRLRGCSTNVRQVGNQGDNWRNGLRSPFNRGHNLLLAGFNTARVRSLERKPHSVTANSYAGSSWWCDFSMGDKQLLSCDVNSDSRDGVPKLMLGDRQWLTLMRR